MSFEDALKTKVENFLEQKVVGPESILTVIEHVRWLLLMNI